MTTIAAMDLELSLESVPLDLPLDALVDLAVPSVAAEDDFAFTLFHESDGEDSPRVCAAKDATDSSDLMDAPRGETVTFVEKTYYMVNTCASSLVCWNATGMGFFILDAEAFARHVLPEYFRHRNMHAFVSELTLHGFRKTVRRHKTHAIECLEFRHAFFVRGDASQLTKITRRAPAQSTVLDDAMASEDEEDEEEGEEQECIGDLKSEISDLKDEVQQTQQLFEQLVSTFMQQNASVHPFMMCPPHPAMLGMTPFAAHMHPGFFHPVPFAVGAMVMDSSPTDIDIDDDDFMAEFFPTLA